MINCEMERRFNYIKSQKSVLTLERSMEIKNDQSNSWQLRQFERRRALSEAKGECAMVLQSILPGYVLLLPICLTCLKTLFYFNALPVHC